MKTSSYPHPRCLPLVISAWIYAITVTHSLVTSCQRFTTPRQEVLGSSRALETLRMLRRTFQTWGPLGQRGWAMQEWYLARRVLHFMPAGPIWACAEMGFSDRTDWPSNRDILTWTEILEQYSWRKFTWVSDRLMALDGLATAYRGLIGDDTYERGIFLSQLPQTLLWAMVDVSLDSEKRDGQPSWHWASKGGHNRFRTESSVKSQTLLKTLFLLTAVFEMTRPDWTETPAQVKRLLCPS